MSIRRWRRPGFGRPRLILPRSALRSRGDPTKLELGREAIADMLRPQLPDQNIGQDFVGIGWFCSGKDDAFQFGHLGQDEGFLAEMRMFPTRGQGAVVMVNSIQGWFLLRRRTR